MHFVIESCERNLMVSRVATSNEFEGAVVGWPECRILMHINNNNNNNINNNNHNNNNNNNKVVKVKKA